MWEPNNTGKYVRGKYYESSITLSITQQVHKTQVWCLQKTEELSVIIIAFPIRHHAVELIHQLCFHLHRKRTRTHIRSKKDVGLLCVKKNANFYHSCCTTQPVFHNIYNNIIMTCLKLPFFLCSQFIMSWKIGIIIFRTSVWGTRVTPRKGPIIPGMKWGLLSPGLHRLTVIVFTDFIKIQI